MPKKIRNCLVFWVCGQVLDMSWRLLKMMVDENIWYFLCTWLVDLVDDDGLVCCDNWWYWWCFGLSFEFGLWFGLVGDDWWFWHKRLALLNSPRDCSWFWSWFWPKKLVLLNNPRDCGWFWLKILVHLNNPQDYNWFLAQWISLFEQSVHELQFGVALEIDSSKLPMRLKFVLAVFQQFLVVLDGVSVSYQ